RRGSQELLITLLEVVVTALLLCIAGSCSFEDDFGACGYRQDTDDTFDWEQVNAREFPELEGAIPHADVDTYMLANTSDRVPGQWATLRLPQIKKNDTHCLDFHYHLSAPGRLSPGTLNVYVAVNGGPLANPIWNASESMGRRWARAELAISTFWPNSYQVIFEAVSSGVELGYIAIDDVQVHSYPCSKIRRFQQRTADAFVTFETFATGKALTNELLWLQRSNGQDIPVSGTKLVNHRRFAASFGVPYAARSHADIYRCVTGSADGAGVSNFAQLIVKGSEPPTPVAPPQLVGAGATYLLVQLNANSIAGDGPVVLREVEYRLPASVGGWAETHAVNAATYKLWHLDPDTRYEVRVLLTRPGEGGTGKSGPPLLARTKCAEPTRPPRGLLVTSVGSRKLSVEWERVGYNVTRCSNFSVAVRCRYRRGGGGGGGGGGSGEALRVLAQHTLYDLPPFTNISVRLVLSNPEGRKESEEIVTQTDEDVPGPIPEDSIRGDTFEDRIFLQWSCPTETNGLISLYEITYQAVSSFDPSLVAAARSGVIHRASNETAHLFSGLFPGTSYAFTLRASTVKGYGPPVTVRLSTNISAPTLPRYEFDEPLNETDTTITVLLQPAASKGAPVSAYQLVVKENRQQQQQQQKPRASCFFEPIGFQAASARDSPHYFAAELPPAALPSPSRFVVGDNRTYNGFWNAPLTPEKSYDVYFQAVSQSAGEIKIDCVRVGRKGASPRPPSAPAPERQMDHTMRVAGIVAGSLALILVVMALLIIFRRRKMSKKRKEGGNGGSRQEMTLMVHAMDKSFVEQSALHGEEPLAFLNAHNGTGRFVKKKSSKTCRTNALRTEQRHNTSSDYFLTPLSLLLPLVSPDSVSIAVSATYRHRRPRDGPDSPAYHTGRLHPAVRVADLLEHIGQMKTGEGYGFKEEYESFFEGQSAPWDVAKRDENRAKNRYGNIIAYDHSRVMLNVLDEEQNSDYINANYVDGYYRTHHYIATQGPLPDTVGGFWRMIWQERSASIIMVTNLVEVGRIKCCKYWPDGSDVYGDIKVTLADTEMLSEYIIRTFRVERAGQEDIREVRQFHFTGWPDHGVPYHATGLLAFIRRIKALDPPHAGPLVVHCSAGAGRTGCYMVIDIMLDMAESEGVIDIYNCVRELRTRRVNMVQTEEQYVFIHDAMLEACLCGDTCIPAGDFRAAYAEMLRPDPQSSSNHIKDEFQTLNMVTPPLRVEDCSIALLPRNHEKNRYHDVLPPDRCLPFLITINGDSSNYINAALMDSYRQPSAFIVTQHPLPNTVKDFWRLVFDYHCTSIVMLNELDSNKYCPQYWPEEGMLCHGPIQVEFVAFNMEGDIITRTFRICNVARPQDGCRMVEQFHYLGWPAGREVPTSRHSFLRLVLAAERWREEYGMDGRTVVHCLNPPPRLLSLPLLSLMATANNHMYQIIITELVEKIMAIYKGLVNLQSQYQFCYDVALEYLETV
uniref:Receptor-type tyrosine-protein phosphatase kappa n=1 Tax=Petromyzon marinus TaxID=7757 RepID=S4RUV8_PETMA